MLFPQIELRPSHRNIEQITQAGAKIKYLSDRCCTNKYLSSRCYTSTSATDAEKVSFNYFSSAGAHDRVIVVAKDWDQK